MNKKMITARVLAILGTILLWLPILATIVTGIIGSIESRSVRFDYLIPAELFPLVGGGSLLLIIASLLSHSQRKWIIWTAVSMILTLVGGSLLATVSGLADGRIEPVGIWWVLVLSMLALYVLTVIFMGIGGIRLIKSVFAPNKANPA